MFRSGTARLTKANLSKGRAKLVVMDPRGRERKSAVQTGKRVVVVALAAALSTVPLRVQESAEERPASVHEVRELRELIQQLQARIASLEKAQPQPGPLQPADANLGVEGKSGGSSLPRSEETPLLEAKRGSASLAQAPAEPL